MKYLIKLLNTICGIARLLLHCGRLSIGLAFNVCNVEAALYSIWLEAQLRLAGPEESDEEDEEPHGCASSIPLLGTS